MAAHRGRDPEVLGGGEAVTPSLDHFYSEDPRRQRSRESDFGVQWREEAAGPRFRVSWIEATSELYALRQEPSHMVELLGRLPQSGHPDPSRSDLIVDGGGAARSR